MLINVKVFPFTFLTLHGYIVRILQYLPDSQGFSPNQIYNQKSNLLSDPVK